MNGVLAVGHLISNQTTLNILMIGVFDNSARCYHYPLKQYSAMVAALRELRYSGGSFSLCFVSG
jgi:hypothetical protein